ETDAFVKLCIALNQFYRRIQILSGLIVSLDSCPCSIEPTPLLQRLLRTVWSRLFAPLLHAGLRGSRGGLCGRLSRSRLSGRFVCSISRFTILRELKNVASFVDQQVASDCTGCNVAIDIKEVCIQAGYNQERDQYCPALHAPSVAFFEALHHDV